MTARCPDEERAMLDRAWTLIPRLAERAPAAAKHVQGGWTLSGRYPFSSGCDRPDEILVVMAIADGGRLRNRCGTEPIR
jgi:alkylation response protein AidB-like acyl-CoA dehydrogenase